MRALRTWTNDCYRELLVLRSGPDGSLDGDIPSALLADVAQAVEHVPAVPAALHDRLLNDGFDGLTDAERATLAIGLLLGRN